MNLFMGKNTHNMKDGNKMKKQIIFTIGILIILLIMPFFIADELTEGSCDDNSCPAPIRDKIWESWDNIFVKGGGIPSSFGDKIIGTDQSFSSGNLVFITMAPAGDDEPIKEIYGQGVRYYASTGFGKTYHNILFENEAASIEIRSHQDNNILVTKFDNIQKNTKENPGYIILDNRGRIVQADFNIAGKSKYYDFNKCKNIYVPKNSRVQFRREENPLKEFTTIIIKEDSKIEETKSIGSNCAPPRYNFAESNDGKIPSITLPNGNIIKGKFFSNGNNIALLNPTDFINTNSLTIKTQEPSIICFSGEEENCKKYKNNVQFSSNGIKMNGAGTISSQNYLIDNKKGSIEINNPSDNNFNVVFSPSGEGEIYLPNNAVGRYTKLFQKEGKTYIKSISSQTAQKEFASIIQEGFPYPGTGEVPIKTEVNFGNKKYNFVSNSDKQIISKKIGILARLRCGAIMNPGEGIVHGQCAVSTPSNDIAGCTSGRIWSPDGTPGPWRGCAKEELSIETA